MVGWSHLPAEIKHHVVKKLDFMGRHSLRNVSHLDRQIVDSTRLKVPRVRFGYKESKCLIVIYTGIDRFLRLELSKYQGGTVIHRSENSFHPSNVSTKIMTSSDPFKLGFAILKSLFLHKSIILNAIEWDILYHNDDCLEFVELVEKNLDDVRKFRVKEFVVMWSTASIILQLITKICVLDDLKIVRSLALSVIGDNIKPVMLFDLQHKFVLGKLLFTSRIYLTNDHETFAMANILASETQKAISDNKFLGATIRDVPSIPKVFEESRYEDDAGIIYTEGSLCGRWAHRFIPENEKNLQEMKSSIECHMSFLCERHTDEFDYWYHQNLPRRLLHEPFWDGLYSEVRRTPESIRDVNSLRARLERDEKMRMSKRTQKTSKVQMTSSWGFKPNLNLLTSNITKSQKKNNWKKMKKVGKIDSEDILEDVKDSDDVKMDSKIFKDVKEDYVEKNSEKIDVKENSEDVMDELTLEDPVLADEIPQNLPLIEKIEEKLSDDVIDSVNSTGRLQKYSLISSAFVVYYIFLAVIFYWFLDYFKF